MGPITASAIGCARTTSMAKAAWSRTTGAITPQAAAARPTRADEARPLGEGNPGEALDIVLARLVADRAAHTIEFPLRMLAEPLCRQLLAADRAVAKAELGRLGGLGKELLALRGVRGQAE